MDWQWSIWVIIELADVIGLITMTLLSRNALPDRIKKLGLLLLALGTAYVFLNAMEIGASSPMPKFIFYRSQVVLLAVTAAVWLAFILQYIHEKFRFTPRLIAVLSILPVVIAVLAATNDIHHIFWAGSFLPSDNPYLFIYGAKPVFWFLLACNGTLFLYGVLLLGRHMRLMSEPLRGDAITIMFAAIVIMITAIIEASRVDRYTPYPMSALTVGFTVAFIMIVEGFRRLRPVHLRPMAEQAAIEDLTDAFIAVDKGNRVFYMNRAAQILTCHSIANAYLRPLSEILPAWPQILNAAEQPSSQTKEINIKDKGNHFSYELNISPINDSVGNLMGKSLLIHDITDRIRADDERRDIERKAQLASRLSTVGQMAAGICHEINNPLTAVIGYSDMLSGRDLPEDVKQQMAYVREGGRRIADIVRQLLAFARNMQPTRTMVDINDILGKTLRLRQYQLGIANIKVVTKLANDLPYTNADPGQLQQVFLNLVLNAEKEMKLAHGRGTLLIKTEQIDDTIKISFKDDGPGISTKNLGNIFDPFFTTRKIGEGTGLGLSVCHGIISEHNGRIYVRSKLGKGATFIVELPIVSEAVPDDITGAPGKKTPQVAGNPGSILVVDDDALLRDFLQGVLVDMGHSADVVANTRDAIAAFKNKKYDLILLDILMPDESGIELYKKLQRIDKSFGSRVLIMTGDTLGKVTSNFLNRTKVPYIEKPFDADILMAKIDGIISRNGELTAL